MSTDREMLENAARAAGKHVKEWAEPGELLPDKGGFVQFVGYGRASIWNSVTDSADALELAVKLRFGMKDFAPTDNPDIAQAPPDAALWGMVEIWRENDDDPIHVEWYKAGADRLAATRLAITRAAASIQLAKGGV